MNRGALSFFLILLFTPLASADIIINEIMYSPSSEFGSTDNEWVELYNSGDIEINLSGWVFVESSQNHNLSGIIDPSEYIILSRKPENFTQYYGSPSRVIEARFRLNNDGEELTLKNADGIVINSTIYRPVGNASGKGKTLERNSSGWFESIAIGGTPGAVNSILLSENSSNQPLNETQNIANDTETSDTIQNQEYSKASSIEIISAPSSLKFGDYASIHAKFNSGSRSFGTMRFVAYIYKPSWITKDLSSDETTLRNSPYNSNAAAEVFSIEANQTIYLVLPLFVKCNEGRYADTSYTSRVRAYEYSGSEWKAIADIDKELFISGESEICKKEIAKETVYINKTIDKDCTKEMKTIRENAPEINVTYPESVFIGENFTTTVFLKNNENISRDLEVYSYIYEHSQIMSSGFDGVKWGNARTANSKKVSIAPENSTTIELLSRARENISIEKYTYKIRIDDLNDGKNSEERIYLIDVKAQSLENKTESYEIKNISSENKITGALAAKAPELSFWGRVIYRIKSWLE